jgi:hypothetical protein
MPHSSTTRTSDTGSHNNSPSASPTQQQIDMFLVNPKKKMMRRFSFAPLPGAAFRVAALNTVWDHPLILVIEEIWTPEKVLEVPCPRLQQDTVGFEYHEGPGSWI